MLSLDTNLLFYALATDRPEHAATLAWLAPLHEDPNIVLSELMLAEFYGLLRNASVMRRPKSAPDAAAIIETYRRHPRWRIVGFPRDDRALHNRLWQLAATPNFAYRRLYDARLAFSLQAYGVTRFATRNPSDFQNLGFQEVFNPLEAKG